MRDLNPNSLKEKERESVFLHTLKKDAEQPTHGDRQVRTKFKELKMKTVRISNPEVLTKFKVEELKQRIEFAIATEALEAESSESAAWKEKKTTVSASNSGGGSVTLTQSWSW